MRTHRDQYSRLLETLFDKRLELRRFVAAFEAEHTATPDDRQPPLPDEAAHIEALSQEVIRELGRLNVALARAKSGHLDVCSDCRGRIAIDTLRSDPCTQICATCARAPRS